MKRAVWVLAVLLAGCATPGERAARVQQEVEEMIAVYGPACERLGYQADTDAWRDCILRLNQGDRLDARGRMPSTTSCIGHRGFLSCTTF